MRASQPYWCVTNVKKRHYKYGQANCKGNRFCCATVNFELEYFLDEATEGALTDNYLLSLFRADIWP